ncbi:hypothetical protein [Synechococcus sp. CBW1006]|jgi:hypothetical protein|uniref:hypothetical protein n=1 Tax=Synechococcus sp. CBW1006 TaxID=1353138 RepID=UPI0018CD216D|nr:hypothetical protein [Synechococcus sp. CBW1006]QPN65535.1 hypothetical protein H8F26_11240 [Synechococcus sp. CBW1006]
MGCRHRDDPEGTIDFRVDVGQGDDQVRFADGLTVPVQTSRDQITFEEKETNSFHLSDNDTDDVAVGVPSPDARALGIPFRVAPVVIHLDHRHDLKHRTTIARRTLSFEDHELVKPDVLGARWMDGRCHEVPPR